MQASIPASDSLYMGILFKVQGFHLRLLEYFFLPEQAQPSCIGAHIAPDVAATLKDIIYGFNFFFYLVSGCSFINIGAHKYLCPQVKRDHHPLVCQGGVKCFKDHPRLNLEFKFQPEIPFGNSISGIYLTYSNSGTWVNAFNVGHQPG